MTTFEDWMKNHNAAYPLGELSEFGKEVWKAAQRAERERIKGRLAKASKFLKDTDRHGLIEEFTKRLLANGK